MLGALIVWSGSGPRLDAIPMTPEGIVVEHARIATDGDGVVVEDLASRSGTFVNGQRVAHQITDRALPQIVRTGNTVALVVANIERWQDRGLVRHGSLVVANSLAHPLAVLEQAARAETHVGIVGPMRVGRGLAQHYAEIVGGTSYVADLDVTQLATLDERLAGATPRTLVLVLHRPLTLPDQPELEQWLETDVRIVTVARGWESFQFMPKALVRRLTPYGIELPQQRWDELPATIADRVHAVAPEATVHATLIESALVHLRRMNEDSLMRFLDDTIARCAGASSIRGSDLDAHIEADGRARNCIVGRP